MISINVDMLTSFQVALSSGGRMCQHLAAAPLYQDCKTMPTIAIEDNRPDLAVLTEPRLIVESDIPWLSALFAKRYVNYPYDPVTSEAWFRNRVLKEPMLFLAQRTDNAFCISMLSVTPWIPAEYETNVVVICAEDNVIWESISLLRASIEWSKLRRCKSWRISSDTSNDISLLAKRLGAEEISPRYVMRL